MISVEAIPGTGTFSRIGRIWDEYMALMIQRHYIPAPIYRGEALPMSDRDALLAAIKANPDEDTPRVAYADWLEEHGGEVGADRAALIREQVVGVTSNVWDYGGYRPRFAVKTLENLGVCRVATSQSAWIDKAPALERTSCLLERGFITRVSTTWPWLEANADRLLEVEWVPEVTVVGVINLPPMRSAPVVPDAQIFRYCMVIAGKQVDVGPDGHYPMFERIAKSRWPAVGRWVFPPPGCGIRHILKPGDMVTVDDAGRAIPVGSLRLVRIMGVVERTDGHNRVIVRMNSSGPAGVVEVGFTRIGERTNG